MKLIAPSPSRFQKVMRILLVIAGILCLLYYCLIGFVAGLIHTSILFIWLVGALFCFLLSIFFPQLIGMIKRWKTWIKILVATPICICLLLFLIGEIAILTGFVSEIPEQDADYLIVLGAKVNADGPSLTLQKRIDAAYAYLAEHPHTIVVASGGQGSDEPMSEADCIADQLIRMGISPDRILLENQSTDTAENIQFSSQLIESSPDKTILVISNDFHCFRAKGIARRYFEAEIGHISADSVIFLLPHYMVREFIGLTVDLVKGNIRFR